MFSLSLFLSCPNQQSYNQNHAEISFNLLLNTVYFVLYLNICCLISLSRGFFPHILAYCSDPGGFSLLWVFIILAEIIMWIVSRWLWKLKPPWNHFMIEESERDRWIIGVKWPSIYLCFDVAFECLLCCVKSQN